MEIADLFHEVAAVLDETVEVDGHHLHRAGHHAAGTERKGEVVVTVKFIAEAAAGGEGIDALAGVDEEGIAGCKLGREKVGKVLVSRFLSVMDQGGGDHREGE